MNKAHRDRIAFMRICSGKFEAGMEVNHVQGGRGMMKIRGRDISMIFQDPMTSLNPVLTVGEQILEVIEIHNPGLSRQESRKWAENMLERVGIPAERFGEYPHQFSGGMK